MSIIQKEDPFIGKTVGHCKILEKINEGGTAYIYKGFNTTFKLNRVIKILKPSLTDDEDFFIRFIQEAQLTARLDHPNILRVFDTGEIDGYYYIEMEYIEGKTLRSIINENRRLSEREILRIASQLVDALNYAHNVKIKSPKGEIIKGILHRDIKPENIMLTADGNVKLMDFGAAKPMNLTSNTMQGMIVGTFHYMSPEQLSGEELDVRSDFFSLGIVLYELFTGKKPFASEKLVTLIDLIKKCRYPSVKKLRPSISPLSQELIEHLLQRRKKDRPSTTKEIKEAINICLNAYEAWGNGKSAKIPFTFKKLYPTISLLLSLIALIISYNAYKTAKNGYYSPKLSKENTKDLKTLRKYTKNLLEKGKEAENKKLWTNAVEIYESVPSPEEGGVANEYLEAQLRRAYIGYKYLNQLTKARAILEKLRMSFSDPTIDAYLGDIYFKQALYNEAKDRYKAAIESDKGSVIKQNKDFYKHLHFYYANALSRQYKYVDNNTETLREAISAWNYFMEFAKCEDNPKDKDCKQAKNFLDEFKKIDKKHSK